jgi:hypothetical protein
VKHIGFPVYWLADWVGQRRISNVLGKSAVSLLHTRPGHAEAWIEVESRLVSDQPPDPFAEANAALEEILWHELEEVEAGPARIVDANAEILRRVSESPQRRIKVVVDQDGVEMLMVGDLETWAAVGQTGEVALRISSKGVEVSAIKLERVRPAGLKP